MNGEMNGIPSALQVCVISGRRPGEKNILLSNSVGNQLGLMACTCNLFDLKLIYFWISGARVSIYIEKIFNIFYIYDSCI